jgi:hypothetical protein
MAKTKQPATQPAGPAKKPAAEKPAVKTGVTLKDLAQDLGRDPKSVRAAIRRLRGGAQVGQGGRYSWPSKTDREYKELIEQLSAKKVEVAE